MTSAASPGEVATIEDVCTACGERNPAGSAFCLYCGVYLGWNEADRQDGSSTRTPVGAPGAGGAPSGTTDEGSGGAGGQSGAGYAAGRAGGAEYGGGGPRGGATGGAEYGGSGYGAAGRGGLGLAGEGAPGLLCPQCGHSNEVNLRFCGKCGQVLRPTRQAIRPAATQVRRSWWQRFWDPADRRARRDYRRSLPPLYRWRRVIVTILTIALVIAGLYIAGKNPVSWAKDRYYDLRGTLVVPEGLAYAADPPESVAPGYDAAALGSAPVDDAWATTWGTDAVAPLAACDGKPAAKGMVRLAFKEPTRVRRLDVLAGLPAANENRPLQFRPSVLLVMYAGQCTELQLKDGAELQQLKLDTGVEVRQLVVAIGATYPARADAGQQLTALTTLTVLSRPQQ